MIIEFKVQISIQCPVFEKITKGEKYWVQMF